MLTVKLQLATPAHLDNVAGDNTPGRYIWTTLIVEADEVKIHNLRNAELCEVAGTCGNRSFAYYVADREKPRPLGFADSVDFYYAAFIENASGKTVESVRF
jgi:hypothetical protein